VETIKWIATSLIIFSAVVAAFGYMPYNFLLGSVGSLFWIYVGVAQSDKPLIALNSFMAILALAAYFNN